jgi:hypothetical protein
MNPTNAPATPTQPFQVALPGGDMLSSLVSAAASATSDDTGQLIVPSTGLTLTATLTDAANIYPPLTVHAVTQAAANAYDPSTKVWNTTATDVWGYILDGNGDPTGILNEYLASMRDQSDSVANNAGFRLTGVDGVVANAFDNAGITVSGICVAAQS